MPFVGQQAMAILNAVFNQDRSALEIIETVKQATDGRIRISIGSIYTQLERLERQGLIKPYYTEKRPAKRRGRRTRYYQITGAGARALTEQDAIRSWGVSRA